MAITKKMTEEQALYMMECLAPAAVTIDLSYLASYAKSDDADRVADDEGEPYFSDWTEAELLGWLEETGLYYDAEKCRARADIENGVERQPQWQTNILQAIINFRLKMAGRK